MTEIDFRRLEGTTSTYGNYGVWVEQSASVPQVRFDRLTTVSAGLQVLSVNLGELLLPDLQSVGGAFSVASTGGLVTLALPSLTTVVGSLSVNNNTSLATLDLPALTSIGGPTGAGYLYVRDNPLLNRMSVPVLAGSVQYVLVYNNPSLTELDVRSLEAATASFGTQSIYVEVTGVLPQVRFDKLATIAKGLRLGSTGVQEFWAPSLVSIGGTLYIASNAYLTMLNLESLATVSLSPITFQSNPMLDCLTDICALKTRLEASGYSGSWVIGPCTCP